MLSSVVNGEGLNEVLLCSPRRWGLNEVILCSLRRWGLNEVLLCWSIASQWGRVWFLPVGSVLELKAGSSGQRREENMFPVGPSGSRPPGSGPERSQSEIQCTTT